MFQICIEKYLNEDIAWINAWSWDGHIIKDVQASVRWWPYVIGIKLQSGHVNLPKLSDVIKYIYL